MFKNLTNFSYKRNWKEAVGFYLAFFLVGVIVGAIAGALVGIQSGAKTFDEGYTAGLGAGAVVTIVYSLAIAFTVLIQRKLHANFGYIVLALFSGLLAAVGGGLLGLIIPAFMTTRGISPSEAQLP